MWLDYVLILTLLMKVWVIVIIYPFFMNTVQFRQLNTLSRATRSKSIKLNMSNVNSREFFSNFYLSQGYFMSDKHNKYNSIDSILFHSVLLFIPFNVIFNHVDWRFWSGYVGQGWDDIIYDTESILRCVCFVWLLSISPQERRSVKKN